MTPELTGVDDSGFLADLKPLERVVAYHTVGMVDPLVAADQSPDARHDDGLSETFKEVIATYGTRHFTIKITGNADEDTERLTRVAETLYTTADAFVTGIDGNEQYDSEDSVLTLFDRLEELSNPALRRFLASTIYIEQPINRDVSLDVRVYGIAKYAPLIIDESDHTLDAFPKHRPLGYSGISSNTCKGLYKPILTIARCKKWTAGWKGGPIPCPVRIRPYRLASACNRIWPWSQFLALIMWGIAAITTPMAWWAAPAEEKNASWSDFAISIAISNALPACGPTRATFPRKTCSTRFDREVLNCRVGV